MTPDAKELAQQRYQMGKAAFERGQYRESIDYLEKAIHLVGRNSRLGGETQLWLVTAYEATGMQEKAIELCEQVSRHPHHETAKQGKRMLYILKAPRLKLRPEWVTKIPDLANLEEGDRPEFKASDYKPKRPAKPTVKEIQPVDLSQVNTRENNFALVALVAIALILSSLFWWH